MRTTVNLDSDVAAAVERQRRARHEGLSEAINRLVRLGLRRSQAAPAFVQRTASMGEARIDLTNIAEALELLEGRSQGSA
ncbi:MAG: CopG family transcriptional regulator [Candidatus Dormibacteria bacterium]